ncbi:TetR/AcrR family transcriptional regulator [Embleya scabrispora]|uniref:TetR/AcrR family transcriptional regulator n=1 Tax=Embleya scabrispora TaxID=159449 RepID=UPI00037F742C|nr:TetR/AcrR family transcriptional regulator [Embleya scabrispora]MYS81325.1 TetR family transcriptional regulator [Streptomyces sp. SID5474]
MSDVSSPPISARAREIVSAARELLEGEGPEAVSMRRIAERIGIKAPSLYKHFPDKSAVENALIAQGMAELAEALEAVEAKVAPSAGLAPGASVAPGEGAVAALAGAYRAYALAHPDLYRLMSGQPLDRAAMPAGLEDRAAGPLVRAVGGDADAARAVWGFAHGMVVLELAGRFPPGADLSGAWAKGCGAFAAEPSSG